MSNKSKLQRRYVVKEVTSTPHWSGCLWGTGCKHLWSAIRLYERKLKEFDDSGSALLLLDRVKRRVVRSAGTADPKKEADYFGW